ncbi:hypothetical protein DX932_31000 [Bacillus cereus]|uniref:Uncharacterized protein n=1 Tax=Bacillus cereus TaxID=1396 RepID=A0A9W7PZ78_BACCE|nr:hypothetical protein DX932_31000 [Bacillus cereus]
MIKHHTNQEGGTLYVQKWLVPFCQMKDRILAVKQLTHCTMESLTLFKKCETNLAQNKARITYISKVFDVLGYVFSHYSDKENLGLFIICFKNSVSFTKQTIKEVLIRNWKK